MPPPLRRLFGKTTRSRDVQPLIGVLRDAKLLLARQDNDFAWSPWSNSEEALLAIDVHIEALESGAITDDAALSILFAPTGAIQEVSVSSGWGDDFVALAKRFDEAFLRA